MKRSLLLSTGLTLCLACISIPGPAGGFSTLDAIKKAAAGSESPVAEVLLENDWILGEGKPLRVSVKDILESPARVTISVRTDFGEPAGEWSQTVSKDDTLSFDFQLPDGFYKIDASCNGKTFKSFVIGYGDPEKVISPADKQDDFDEFWENSLSELAAVDPGYKMTPVPEYSNDVRKTCRVEMRSWGNEPITALVCTPVKEGKYPVYVNFLGYNCDPWYEDPSANPESIYVSICTRRQGLSRIASEPADFVTRGLGNPKDYYYHGAFLDCVRGIDLACSLEGADPERIYAEGGSQGGAFTFAAAALDKRVKAIALFVPFLSDYPDYFKIASWPGNEVTAAAAKQGISDEDLYRTLSYMDIKNLTDRITCPVLMGFGLQDDTCPPHTNFAGFNNLSSEDRTWICFPLSGHHVEREPGWNKARNAFFKRINAGR